MQEDNFRKNFPADGEVPEALIRLLHYQEGRVEKGFHRLYSGHFSLYDKYWQLPFILPKLEEYFIPFGYDADGAIYAFWLYQKMALKEAPIVFIGEYISGNVILANSVEEFLALLSLGVDGLGFAVNFPPDWLDHFSNSEETLIFRNWLQTTFDITVPENPLQIVQQAKDSHPDFNEWLGEKTGYAIEELPGPPWE